MVVVNVVFLVFVLFDLAMSAENIIWQYVFLRNWRRSHLEKKYFVNSITLGRVSPDHYEQNDSFIHDEGVVLFSNAGKRMIF